MLRPFLLILFCVIIETNGKKLFLLVHHNFIQFIRNNTYDIFLTQNEIRTFENYVQVT